MLNFFSETPLTLPCLHHHMGHIHGIGMLHNDDSYLNHRAGESIPSPLPLVTHVHLHPHYYPWSGSHYSPDPSPIPKLLVVIMSAVLEVTRPTAQSSNRNVPNTTYGHTQSDPLCLTAITIDHP
jgi:hypothetical protein